MVEMLILICVISVFININIATITYAPQPGLNFSHLIYEYYLFCGADYLCDNNRVVPPFITPNRTYRADTKHCPECFCDDQCLRRGDCCPDSHFSLPELVCTNTTVLNYTGEYSQGLDPKANYHLLVNSCPTYAEKNITDKCLSIPLPRNHLFSPVVTSKGFPVSYVNKYCAQCNGEPETEVDEWLLGIDCVFFADFNFLSSIQSIIDLAKERHCRFRYTSPTPELVAICDPNKQMKNWTIGQCNQTGTWTDYDETIEIACHANYEVPHRLYKNVFCYMCNPPRHMPRDIIDVCNATSLWSPPDVQLEQACASYATSQYTLPFKNVFCFLCNRVNKETFSFLEAQVNATERYDSGRECYFYDFHIDFLRVEYLIYLYKQFPVELWNNTLAPEDMTDVRIDGLSRNITNLAFKHFATFPYGNYCQREMIPLQYAFNGGSMCSCKDSCVFESMPGKCCVDKSVTIPLGCINEQGIKKAAPRSTASTPTAHGPVTRQTTSEKKDALYLVIDGCDPRVQNSFMRNRCESDSINDLFSFLPFDIGTFYGEGIHQTVQYRNFDCVMCRQIIPAFNSITISFLENLLLSKKYFSWNVSIQCTEILETEHNVLLFDVIRLAEYLGCEIKLKHRYSEVGGYPFECMNGTYFHKPVCNTTNKWPVYDPDVKWACENTTNDALPEIASHKNYFCYLCNPEIEIVEVIETCNVTGGWQTYSASLQQACELFPRIYSKSHYKNIFCEKCNTGNYSLPPMTYPHRSSSIHKGEGGTEPKFYMNTYRNLFSVASYDEEEEFNEGELCSNRQIYDAYKVQYFFTTRFCHEALTSNMSCILRFHNDIVL